jgi:hypothetical protein
MTKSQFKRNDVKEISDLVGNIADDIDTMFATSNQEAMSKARAEKAPKYPEAKNVFQADDDEELAVSTGRVPDWAITQGGKNLTKPNEVLAKETEYNMDREIDNAESSISLQPSPRGKFTIEKGFDKKITDDKSSFSQSKDEDRESYDQNEFNILKHGTGKFFDDNLEDEKSPEQNPPPRKQWKQSNDHEKSNDSPLKPPVITELAEDSDLDTSAVEIENIMIKNHSNDKKPPQRSQWNKPKKAYSKDPGSNSERENNPINNVEVMKESGISKDEVVDGFMEGLDMTDNTPKPNLKYPVPSNERQDASFGVKSNQIHQMRQANAKADVDIESLDSPKDYVMNEKNSDSEKRDSATASPEELSPEAKNEQRSRIPVLKIGAAGKSKERRIDMKKQSNSFVGGHNDELEEAPKPHILEDKKNPDKNAKMHKLSPEPQFLGVENDSTKNNFNLSNQPVVKSEGNSAIDEFLQKEDSVHIDDKHRDIKSETFCYPNTESVGDTHLENLMNESNAQEADPVTTAAVNASMNLEIQKINESLQKLVNITWRSESKKVKLMPEVSDSLNKSFNLLLTTMANLKANRDGFEANIKF